MDEIETLAISRQSRDSEVSVNIGFEFVGSIVIGSEGETIWGVMLACFSLL